VNIFELESFVKRFDVAQYNLIFFSAFLFLGAISYFMLSFVCYDDCLSYQMIIKTRHDKLCVVTPSVF